MPVGLFWMGHGGGATSSALHGVKGKKRDRRATGKRARAQRARNRRGR